MAAAFRGGQQVVKQGFLWCMAAVYLFAFTSLYVQIPGLYGHNGLLPASYVLHDLSACSDKTPKCALWASAGECEKNGPWMKQNCRKSCKDCPETLGARFSSHPTLLWITSYVGLDTPSGMEFLCLIGILLSLLLLVLPRYRDCISFFGLWSLYFSLVQVGQLFLWYQWDGLLLESGFIAILVSPWNLVLVPWRLIFLRCRQFKNVSRHHDRVALWLIKWLLFRLMFASGVVKLTALDPTWWDLTALDWHYESQCIPTPVAWYAQKLPEWLQKFSVTMTYVIEIGLPVLFFVPVRLLRATAYCGEVLLQLLILLTGNYNFFNLLTIILCISLLDDECILSRLRCFMCKQCCCSKCSTSQSRADEQSTDNGHSYTKVQPEDVHTDTGASQLQQDTDVDNRGATSTGLLITEHVFDWLHKKWPERSLLIQARDLLRSQTARRLTTGGVLLSVVTTGTLYGVFTARWFSLGSTPTEPLRCEIAFTPPQFFEFVNVATRAAVWIGFVSLMIEIAGAFMRCLLVQCGTVQKAWSGAQCTAVSLVALWLFAVSLDPFTSIDRRVQSSLPRAFRKWSADTRYLQIANAYGLFRSMTGVGGRPEIIIQGSESLDGPWKEYSFLYKPGNVFGPPPFVAPHQPRLDWQMWFTALESYESNPWFMNLLHKLLLGDRDVLQLMGGNPFADAPPQYLRTQLYLYHYTRNTSSLWDVIFHPRRGSPWWTREFVRNYTPFTLGNSSMDVLVESLKMNKVYRPEIKQERAWGPLHSLVVSLRPGYKRITPPNLINALFFFAVTCSILRAWWRKMGRKFFYPGLFRVRDKCEVTLAETSGKVEGGIRGVARSCPAPCTNCRCCVEFTDKLCQRYRMLCDWFRLLYAAVLEKLCRVYQRARTTCQEKKPSIKGLERSLPSPSRTRRKRRA